MELEYMYASFCKTREELVKKGLKIVDDDQFISALQYSQRYIQESVASDTEKLQFYGLFKQGTMGDQADGAAAVESPKSDAKAAAVVAISKVQAWKALRGMEKEVAMTNYVLLLDKLAPGWRLSSGE